MRGKRIIALVAALTAVMALAAPAMAEHDDTTTRTGRLLSMGTGVGELDGSGVVRMLVLGDVTITGPSDLDVKIFGIDTPPERAGDVNIELTDYYGLVVVRGENFNVVAEGQMWVLARGHGHASFTGEGIWRNKYRFKLWENLPETDFGG